MTGSRLVGFLVWALFVLALLLALGLPAYAVRVVITDAGAAYLYTPEETRVLRAYIHAQAEEIERLRVHIEQRCLQ
jgi:hypothetical protein